jgi:ketosteroid isomerase-like protein
MSILVLFHSPAVLEASVRSIVWVIVLCLSATIGRGFAADPNQGVAGDIIAIVKAEWSAEQTRNIDEKGKNIADDYTEFNDESPTRVDGKSVASRLEAAGWKDPAVYIATEMLNPRVQVYGDTAVLTYNFMGLRQGKDGKVEPDRAKVTRVYVKENGRWMLVHAHF